MKKIALCFILFLVECSLFASDNLQQFWQHVQTLRNDYSNGSARKYRLGKEARIACEKLAGMTRLDAQTLDYYLQLDWINDVVNEIDKEPALRKRQLIYANLVDTLTGLLMDLQTSAGMNGATKKEMHEALDRAMQNTCQVRLSKGMPVGKQAASVCQGGYVLNQPGEAVSFRSAESCARSSSRTYASKAGSSMSSSYSGSGGSAGGTTTGGQSRSVQNQPSSQMSVSKPFRQTQIQKVETVKVTKQPERTVSDHQTMMQQQLPPPKPPRPPVSRPKPGSEPKPKPEPVKPVKISDYIFWLLMGLCLIAFILMLYFMFKKARKKMETEQKEVAQSEHTMPPERLRTETIYDKALKAAAEGDYAEGIRLLTIGALLKLEEHRVMTFNDSLTNGEYLRGLLKERKLYSIFHEPMGLFDLVIYGFRPVQKNDFEKFKAFYLELEQMQ